jgi:ComF family protein
VGEAAAVRARLTAAALTAADALLAVLFAPTCAACGEALDTPARGAVCQKCWGAIPSMLRPYCRTCGDALASWRVISTLDSRCARCRRRPPLVGLTRAIGPYDGSLRAIIHAFKYDPRPSLARPLGARMRGAADGVLTAAAALVPVPLHPARERARGFNQARELACALDLPVLDALRRIRHTPPQADLPAARRHANVKGAFALAPGCRVHGLTLVLVDDVSTTGATLDACARVLLAAGARDVRALTAARAVRQSR